MRILSGFLSCAATEAASEKEISSEIRTRSFIARHPKDKRRRLSSSDSPSEPVLGELFGAAGVIGRDLRDQILQMPRIDLERFVEQHEVSVEGLCRQGRRLAEFLAEQTERFRAVHF